MNNQKKELELNLDNIIAIVYKKIATWHNDNPTQESLKGLSTEIVDDVLSIVASELEIRTRYGINKDAAKQAVDEYYKQREVTTATTQSPRPQMPQPDKEIKGNADNNIFKKLF